MSKRYITPSYPLESNRNKRNIEFSLNFRTILWFSRFIDTNKFNLFKLEIVVLSVWCPFSSFSCPQKAGPVLHAARSIRFLQDINRLSSIVILSGPRGQRKCVPGKRRKRFSPMHGDSNQKLMNPQNCIHLYIFTEMWYRNSWVDSLHFSCEISLRLDLWCLFGREKYNSHPVSVSC
jgi:hypothetical protein